ncbi:MAG: NAD-dependent succinate-semialdehyde dehydrogenase [Acidimicrobiales bacterium]
MLETSAFLSAGRPVPQWIGGEWIGATGALSIPVMNPATGEMLGRLSYGGRDEASAAANAAAEAFPSWSGRPARQRADILRRAADLLASRADEIGRLLAAETGKRVPEAVGETNFAAEYLRWFAEETRRPQGQVLTSEDPTRRQLTLTRPVGVAACLTPWNFPISIQARKVAPALAAGCTVVARASEKAPLAVLELFRALEDAGLPPGVANVIHGPAGEQSEVLLAHPAVRMVSFTGSTAVGTQLMSLASSRIVRCALELGGDAPFIIFADADIDAAVEGLLIAKFRNNGQSCIGANRVFVERSILQEVADRLAAATSHFSVGDPLGQDDPDVGPLIDIDRVAAVGALVDEALDAGARWLGEGPRIPRGPCYTRPGFLVDVPAEVGMATTEVFGPVSGLFPFDTEDEVIVRSNTTEMGLAGYVYTRCQARSWRMAERMEVGILGINHPLPSVAFAPLGGVKQSGIGREGAHQGLEEFTDTRYVSIGL